MKKTKIVKILLSLILVSALMLNLTSMTSSKADIEKISTALLEKMTETKENISVVIWLTAPDIATQQNALQTAVMSTRENSDVALASNTKAIMAQEHVLKINYRNSVKQVYLQNNTEFISSYINEEDIVFTSKYAPMVIADLTVDEIFRLSNNEDVVNIDYYQEPIFVEQEFEREVLIDEVSSLTEALRANDSPFTGAGVNIGVFDSGVPRAYATEGLNVVDTLGDPDENGDHPEFVAGVLKEIAPNANYYFAGNFDFTNIDSNRIPHAYIEWLLDQGVDVINMSMGYIGDGASMYGNFTKWFDHIAYNHYVLIVKSAGNTVAQVSSPGMAYNVMTVGAMKQSSNGWIFDAGDGTQGSGYYTGSVYASKPDIVAASSNATSGAAPVVTATAALLLEADPMLIYSPELLKAIMTAAVDMDTDYHYVPAHRSTSGVNYMKAGAGMLNVNNALEVAVNGQTRCSSMAVTGTQRTYNFTITSSEIGSTVRVAMAYTVPVDIGSDHINGSATTYGIPNLDLYVYAPNNTSISWQSVTTNNNVEIVEFTPEVAGTYTIKVVTTTGIASTENIYFGVAWSFD